MTKEQAEEAIATNETEGQSDQQGTQENNVPQSRLDDAAAKKREAEQAAAKAIKERDALLKEKAEREEKEKIARGEHQQVIESQKAEIDTLTTNATAAVARIEALEAALQATYDQMLTTVPDDLKDLMDSDDVLENLTTFNKLKVKGVFDKPDAPNSEAGARGEKQKTSVIKVPKVKA